MTARPEPTASVAALLARSRGTGDAATRAAGRLMTLLENRPECLPELLAAAGPDRSEPRWLLGLTGAPGSGKSTLADAMVAEYRRRWPEQRIGVIAVDPSSPFSGGAVLGDRVRMMRHALDPRVFVRSLASRGHLGGLAAGVKGVLHVMGAIGIDAVLIETVGVGQSEVEVAGVADQTMVVLAPGQGDSVQLLKAGLLEIGDFLVVNKADREGAADLHAQVLATLQLDPVAAASRHVALVSALDRAGVEALVDAVETRVAQGAEQRRARRAERHRNDIRDAVLATAEARVRRALASDAGIAVMLRALEDGGTEIDALVHAILTTAAHFPARK